MENHPTENCGKRARNCDAVPCGGQTVKGGNDVKGDTAAKEHCVFIVGRHAASGQGSELFQSMELKN